MELGPGPRGPRGGNISPEQRLNALKLQRIQLANSILPDADHEEAKRLQAALADQQREGQQSALTQLDAAIAAAESGEDPAPSA